ncbi:MAG: DedA family protein [Oscillospiraceae bacterium]|nr:DedA family protein [Oscillospiraceae bacterium]
MEQMMIDIINGFGYIGIAFLIAVENIFPPIPSEVILTFGGFLTTVSNMNVWGVILSATVGAVVGALVLYYLGRLLNAQRLEKLFESKLGRRLHLKKEDVRRAEGWFSRHGNKTVFFCRFIPLVRSLISIPAGAAKMQMGSFLLLTAVGTAIWNTVLVLLGKFAGDAWGNIVNYVNVYSLIAVGVLAVIAIVVGVIFIKKRFLNPRGTAGKDEVK